MYELSKKKNLTIKVIASLFVLFLITTALKIFLKRPEPNVGLELLTAASEINKHTPIYIDSTNRLDNVEVIQNSKLQYNYSITNHVKEELDTIKILEIAKEEMLDILKKNPKTSYFKENNVDIIVNYSDKNGTYLCKLIITKNDYP